MKKLLAALSIWGVLFGVCSAGIPPIPPGAPTPIATNTQAGNLLQVYMSGDSLTAGNQDQVHGAIPKYLSQSYGWNVTNGGIGGQTSNQICQRQGGCAFTLTVTGNVLNGGSNSVTAINGSAVVSMSSNSAAGQPLSTQASNNTINMSGTLCGVHGTLQRTASGGPPSTAETYAFLPDVSPGGAACAAASAFTPDATVYYPNSQILWYGRNNYASASTVEANIASAVAAITSGSYVSLSVVNADIPNEYSGTSNYNTIIGINTLEASLLGPHYLDVRSYLVSQYNPGNALDVFDHSNDVPPSSLRAVVSVGTAPALTNSQTSFTAASVTNGAFTPNNIITIDSEYMQCSTVAGTTVSGCVRGFAGSTATTHSASAPYTAIDYLHYSSAAYKLIAQYLYANRAAWMAGQNTVSSVATANLPPAQGLLSYQPGPQYLLPSALAPYAGAAMNVVGGPYAGQNMYSASVDLLGANANTFLGWNAGGAVTSASQDVYVGFQAGTSYPNVVGSGSNNIAVGAFAGPKLTTGSFDTYVGSEVGLNNNGGQRQTGVGYQALVNANANNGTAVGASACKSVTSGTNNLCLGVLVGSTTLTTGSSNILIGTSASTDTPVAATANYLSIQNWLTGDTAKGILNVNSPTVATTPTSCGTSPAVTTGSGDVAGEVTEGTIATGCVVPFANTHTVAPFCTVVGESGLAFSYAVSTTAITVTNIGALSSTKLAYTCIEPGATP